MVTVVTFAIPHSGEPSPDWVEKVLAEHPDSVPDMRPPGCTRIRSEVDGKAARLTFYWATRVPLPGVNRMAFAGWWAARTGWKYEIETRPDAFPPSGSRIGYVPDVNGRPCRDEKGDPA
jgi:hypothetical protein